MRAIGIGLALACAWVGAASAQTPPESLTWMVLNEINGAYFDRNEPLNHPDFVRRVPEGMIRAVDVTPDGQTDWLIDYERGEFSSWCGTGGCRQTLYVTDSDTLILAMDMQGSALDIREINGERRVEIGVHHTGCVPDNWNCRYAFAWAPELRRMVERPTFEGVGLLAPGVDPIDAWAEAPLTRPDLPEALAQAWREAAIVCDGETRQATVRDVPDLNGDHARDWILMPPYPCEASEGSVFSVWLSAPSGGVRQRYVSEADRWPAFDITDGGPALLISNPACSFDTECPNQRLRWDVVAGTFVPAT
jgi:hypothetical protein